MLRRRRPRRFVLAGLALLLGATACGTVAEGERRPGTPAAPSVLTRELDLADPSRNTGPATPGRALPTTLWYPARRGDPLPVVVFSHGFGSSPGAYAELLTSWAKAGYLVVAPRFPLTAEGSPLVLEDIRQQPADVSFVLRQVLALDTTPGDELAGRIDEARVAAAGHSAGAATTLGLLTACCTDPLLRAVVLLAPTLRGFGPDLAGGDLPALVVHGTSDLTVPVNEGRAAYAALPGPKVLVELTGGGHSAPFDTAEEPGFAAVRTLTTLFLDGAVRDRADALAELRSRAATIPGVVLAADGFGD